VISGGDGTLGIQADGTMTTFTATCGPVARNRQAFAERNFALALVDATSAGLVYGYQDILAVVRHVQADNNVPTWFIGGSAATATIANLAANFSPASAAGAVFFSPSLFSPAQVGSIKRPALVVWHSADVGQTGNSLFNALTSAIPRERSVQTAGNNLLCGYHLLNGLDNEFVAVVSSFIERNNSAARAAAALNFQGLWWNAPANSESGWGLNITHQGDTLFATWFTYDIDGRGTWLVMSAGTKGADNSYSGALYRTTGPAFSATPFDPRQVVAAQVGTATLTFTDADRGTFAYTVNGASQSKSITRQVYSSPVPECVAGGATGSAINYQALWWSPAGAESGWGVNIAHQGEILFATWFTYDASGRGMWLVMSSAARTAPGTYSGALYRTTGPAFNAAPWTGPVIATQVGNATFTFTSADNGTFSYTLDGISQSKPITRQVYSTPVTVCR
jgi:hypothetical protein